METRQANFQSGRYSLEANFRIAHYIDTEIMDIERHDHPYYECIFFFSGDVAYWVGNQCYYPEPGDVLLLNIAQVHIPKMQSATPPYDRITLFLDKTLLLLLSDAYIDFTSLFESPNGRLIHLPNDDGWRIKSILSKIQNCYGDNSTSFGNHLLLRCHITELLIYLGRLLPHTPADISSMNGKNKIYQIKEYIAKNLDVELSLDELAQRFHMSKYHMAHEFQKQTGISPYSYIIKRRLAKAQELLRSGYAVKETGTRCGFHDDRAFSRAFKKEYGATPTQYLHDLRL